MSKASELGKKGEALACELLQKKGYAIRAKNYSFDRAELDIIAEINNTLVFVEVKTRESDFLTDPALLVSMSKQRQIIKAADAYIKEHDLSNEGRFDIVINVINSKYTKSTHIEDAFYPTL